MFCFALLQTKTQAYLAWIAYRNLWQFYNGCWFLKNNNIISLLHNQLRYSIKKTAYFALILSLLNLKCLEKYIHVNFCKERFDMICLTLSQIRSNKFWTRKKKDKKKKYQSIYPYASKYCGLLSSKHCVKALLYISIFYWITER